MIFHKLYKKTAEKLLPFFIPTIFFIIYSIISLHKHLILQSTMFDLGLMHQRVWTTLHGVYMHVSLSRPILEGTSTFMIESSFRPILNLFVPVYALFPDPIVLLISQTLSVIIGSIPIYLFAKEKLNSSLAGLIFQFAYFIYPQTLNSVLFDFHPMTFAISFLSWGFYLLIKNKTTPAVFLLTLSMFAREAIAFTVSAIGVYIILIQKKYRVGLLLTFVSLSYFLFIFLFLYPNFGLEKIHPYFSHPNFETYTRYEWLGSNLFEIAYTIINKPNYILSKAIQPQKIYYLRLISKPFIYLNLLSPIIITYIPALLVNLLSEKHNMYSGGFQYEVTMIPFFFFSAIYSLSLIKKLKRTLKFQKLLSFKIQNILLILILSSFISQFSSFSSPQIPRYRLKMLFSGKLKISNHAKKINSIKKLIGENDSVSTQNNLGPHFASRMNIYSFPLYSDKSDYVLVDLYDPYQNILKGPCAVCIHPVSHQEYYQNIFKLFSNEKYGVFLYDDGYLLFKKGYERTNNQYALSQIKEILK